MQTWQLTHSGITLAGLGSEGLMGLHGVAFFASRQCPGVAIRAAMDWALQQAKAGQVVMSGFHSPLEQSVLTVLLQARSPVVAVLARPVQGARLPPAWAQALATDHMAVISTATTVERLTRQHAAQRNRLVAQLASRIVVAHASPGGDLAGLCAQWLADGKQLAHLSPE